MHGRQVNLVVGDDGYEPERAIDETLKTIEQQKVFSQFGWVGTPTANAVLPVVNEMDVPLIGIFTGAMSLRLFQRNRLAIKTGLAAMLEANPNAVVMSAPARRWRRSSGKRVRQT